MINFRQLVSREYLLEVDFTRLHPTDHGLAVLGAALTLLGIILRIMARWAPHELSRHFRQRLSTWALTIGLLEVLWFGLRYQNAPALGSHLAAFLVLLLGLIWLFYIVRYRFGSYRGSVQQWQREQVKQKYLQK